MEQKHLSPSSPNEEISLKELVGKVQVWGKYLLRQWKPILLMGLLGAGLGFAYALSKKKQYVAEITFVLEESKSSQLGAYAGIASQFGIDLGGSSGSGVFSGDNILAFLKSRLMIEKTLLSPVNFKNKTISLADAFVEVYGLKDKWQEKEALKNIQFPFNVAREKFSLVQDSLLATIYTDIADKNLLVEKPDKKLNFIAVKCKSPDEDFSKAFSERLVKEATDFYVETKTKRSKVNVDKLQVKADSLEHLLNQKTYSVAASQDLNLNPARSVAKVSTQVAARDQMVLQTMYGEVVKNLELSRMSMAQETPIIQIIDSPILPLKKEKVSKLKSLVLGGLLGGFLTCFFLVFRRVFRQLMQ